MRKLLEPLRKYKRQLFILAVVFIVVIMFLHIVPTLGNLVTHNASDVSLLGIELLNESGPDFKDAAKKHLEKLKTYTEHMEDKYLAEILSVFWSEYSPKEGFARAKETLKEANDVSFSQEECAKAIWLAGEQIEQYRMKSASFLKLGFGGYKYLAVSDELVEDIKLSINESKKSLERFKKNRTLKNAVWLCEDNRWTMLLLFLARTGCNSGHEKLFDEFHELEKEVQVEEQKLFDKLPDADPKKRFLGHIIQSEGRRLHVVEALKVGDMRKARTLMWEAIEIAYHNRPIILEFTAAVNYGKGWKRPDS